MTEKASFLYVKMGSATTPAIRAPAMQNDAIKAPENCGSMDELRTAIDALLTASQLVTPPARQTRWSSARRCAVEKAAATRCAIPAD